MVKKESQNKSIGEIIDLDFSKRSHQALFWVMLNTIRYHDKNISQTTKNIPEDNFESSKALLKTKYVDKIVEQFRLNLKNKLPQND